MIEKKYPEMNDEEKAEMWDAIADELSSPKNYRRSNKEIYDFYQIPESTFYWKTTEEEFLKKIVKKALLKAKKSFPDILDKLEKLALSGKEKSIEMYLEYIVELSKKMDITTKGESINDLGYERAKRIIEEGIRKGSDKSDLPK
jgi:hypothetical protein